MKPQTETWLEMAENDLAFAREVLQHGQRPFYAAHFCHQSVEKLLKAIVQERSEDTPPRTHNFTILIKHAGIDLPPEKEEILLSLAPHYLATRYPEDISRLYRQYTDDYVRNLLSRTEELFSWLKTGLTSSN
jgi:HEPN domain-containing protein